MLALLASLRADELKPADALAQAVKIGSDSKAPDEERVRAWVIAAEAADDLKNPAARIAALQDGLGLESGELDADDIFTLNPSMLWDAYLAYGQDLGNELQLVVGDDAAWFVAASNRFDTDPVRACALFSVVAYHAQDKKQVQVAHWQFASLIHRQTNGDTVLRHLYLDSDRFKDVKSIPADVRYLLADAVLELPDIPLASQLMQGLDAPPPDTDPATWQLQRARVFILGGNPDAGVAALQTLQGAGAKLDPDALLPVLFDLQTLGHDKEAIPFFEVLLGTELASEQRRQLLYWTADSYKALGNYSRAAELYLRSALLTDPFAMDPWAQTARYQAAQMLAKAGYIDDARNLYHGLMNATRDPARQAVLQHDLQQLLLMPTKHGAGTAQD
jgi:tetratricopeptide (TPR) repeat protein